MNKIKCKWLGPTGSTPEIGYTVTGEVVYISENKFQDLSDKKLVKKITETINKKDKE